MTPVDVVVGAGSAGATLAARLSEDPDRAVLLLEAGPDHGTDYDRWARELGCTGWGWAEMSAAFLAVEDDLDHGGDGHHGGAGRSPSGAFPPRPSHP